jgi:TRAP-type C4-dicarboxylate transport system permease small subunit
MSKRPPYLEIILTVLVMAFLGLVIAGGFNQGDDNVGQVTMRPD